MTQCPHEGNLGSSWYPTRKRPKFTPCFLVFFWLAICGNILRLFAVWPNPGTIVLTLSSYHPHVSAENSWWLLTNLYYNPWKLEETKNCHNRKIIEHNLGSKAIFLKIPDPLSCLVVWCAAPALESHATPLHRKGEAAARHSMRACLVLLEAAKRKEKKALPKPRTTRNIVDVCPLTVVKNLYIIHGSLGNRHWLVVWCSKYKGWWKISTLIAGRRLQPQK